MTCHMNMEHFPRISHEYTEHNGLGCLLTITMTTFTLRSNSQKATRILSWFIKWFNKREEVGVGVILLDENEKQHKYKTSSALRAGGEHPGPVQMNSCLTLLACDVMASRGTVSRGEEGSSYLLAENERVSEWNYHRLCLVTLKSWWLASSRSVSVVEQRLFQS